MVLKDKSLPAVSQGLHVLCFGQWYAVCLSDVGDYEGVKVKIGNSYIIKEHLEVVQINAEHDVHCKG